MNNRIKTTYKTTADLAKEWNVTDRTVRGYCVAGLIPGAEIIGKSWRIPADAKNPRAKTSSAKPNLLQVLRDEKESQTRGGIYHNVQVDLTYNSNHIEGSTLTHEQTRLIFETSTISIEGPANVDDIVETANHFRCIDEIIAQANQPLSEALIKRLHFLLKTGTSDSRKDWFAVGDYKKLPNEVGGKQTAAPEDVEHEIKELLSQYKTTQPKTFEELIAFHHDFEAIHPFQDGNGRVGRLILFKECLRYNIVPFIIDEEHRWYYYRGLSEWENEPGFLLGTCRSAQDKFKAVLNYFRIPYGG